jgi:hypothetical protein
VKTKRYSLGLQTLKALSVLVHGEAPALFLFLCLLQTLPEAGRQVVQRAKPRAARFASLFGVKPRPVLRFAPSVERRGAFGRAHRRAAAAAAARAADPPAKAVVRRLRPPTHAATTPPRIERDTRKASQ